MRVHCEHKNFQVTEQLTITKFILKTHSIHKLHAKLNADTVTLEVKHEQYNMCSEISPFQKKPSYPS